MPILICQVYVGSLEKCQHSDTYKHYHVSFILSHSLSLSAILITHGCQTSLLNNFQWWISGLVYVAGWLS